jgi:hypothetical protein
MSETKAHPIAETKAQPIAETKAPETKAQPIAEDLVIGAKSIGAEVGRTERQAYHMLENGILPGFKLGSQWAAKRSKIKAHIDALVGE